MINKAVDQYGRLREDPTIKAWGMRIGGQMAEVDAHILPVGSTSFCLDF